MKGCASARACGGKWSAVRVLCAASVTMMAVIGAYRATAQPITPPAPPPPSQAQLEEYSTRRVATSKNPLDQQRVLEAGIEPKTVYVRSRSGAGGSTTTYEPRQMQWWETPSGMELMAWEGSYMPDTFRPAEGVPYRLGYRMQMGALPAWVPPSLFPSGADMASSSEALVPAGMAGHGTGWQGKGRATVQGMVDLMTGSPLIQRTDLELPVGQSMFRFNRTRSSMHGTSFSTLGTIGNKGVFDATDRMWDWAGTGWMVSENPILLIDDARPDEIGSGPRTTWLVLDAHRSIPFQWIEDLKRYEAPPRFRATLTYTETFTPQGERLTGSRGQRWPGSENIPRGDVVSSVRGWTEMPREWKVSLYGGALTYTFTLIPQNQIKHVWDPALALNPGLSESPLLESTMHDRPFLLEDFLGEGGQSNNLPESLAGQGVWSNALTSGDGSPTSAQPGYGVPHLAILTKIEGECGTVVDLHYAKVRQRPMDWDQTTSLYEMHQDALSVGQLKYLTVTMSPDAKNEKGQAHPQAGQIVWTAVYSHRHFVGVHSEVEGDQSTALGGFWNDLRGYPWFMGVDQTAGDDEHWWRRTMQGFSAIDRIYVYEGGLPSEVLAHEMVSIATDAEDAAAADDLAAINAPIDRLVERRSLTSDHVATLKKWRHAIRHDYNVPGDVPVVQLWSPSPEPSSEPPFTYDEPVLGLWPWWEVAGPTLQPVPASGPVGPPLLVMTSVFEQVPAAELATTPGPLERRDRSVVIYELPGWYTFEGPGSEIASRPQADRRGSWELPWVTAILDETDIERVLRAKWNPAGDENAIGTEQLLVGSLAELVYQRRVSGPLAAMVFSERRREEIVRLASMQFASSLGKTWTTGDPDELAKRYSPSMQSLWVNHPTLGQYVRTGAGSVGENGIDPRAMWDGHVATVGDISIGGDGRQTEVTVGQGAQASQSQASNRGFHARIHRYMQSPGGNFGFDQHVYRQRNEGSGHFESGPPLASVFLHPFRWHSFRAWNRETGRLGSDALTQAPDRADLRSARVIVVVDEFEDRASMRSGVPAFTPRETSGSYEPMDSDAYSSAEEGGLKKGMLARTVYELNPWGYVLRQRRWEFRDGQATQSVQGIGEEYIYSTIEDMLDAGTVAAAKAQTMMPEGQDPAFWDVPSVQGLLEQIVLAERRSVGWSVADGVQTSGGGSLGATEGLIETVKYELALPAAGTPQEIADQLSLYGWSERLRQKAMGFKRGTGGDVHYQTQRFYHDVRLNEVMAEVRFNTPRVALMTAPPTEAEVLSNAPLALGYQATLHRFKVMHDQPQDHPNSHVIWRQRIDPPVQQTPGGPWYFPTERRYLTSDHQNPFTVTALLQNPMVGPRGGAQADPDEMVVWTVQETGPRGEVLMTVADTVVKSPYSAEFPQVWIDDTEASSYFTEVGGPYWDFAPNGAGEFVQVENWPRKPGRWGSQEPANRVVVNRYGGEDYHLTDRIEKGRRYAKRIVKDQGDPDIEGDEVS